MRHLKCDLKLRQKISRQMSNFEVQELPLPKDGLPAAVALIVTDLGNGAELSGLPITIIGWKTRL